jgi:protein-tyrosine phosphatase
MVDIHCHLLPNVDDGPRSWDICLQMCEMARADGIEHIVATPHANDEFRYEREKLSIMLEELSQRVAGNLELSLGCDFHLSYENFVDVLKNPSQYTISSTDYLLVELSDFSVPPSVSQSLHRLLEAGIVPIITHPERNLALRTNPQRVLEWVEDGCLVQVTANSLTGLWGRQAQQTAEWLMRHSAVHVMASDAHGVGSRPPILSDGLRAAEKILGKHAAEALVSETPRAIVRGESVRRGLGASDAIPRNLT